MRTLTHVEALLWLNDHIGQVVHVSLRLDVGDSPRPLLDTSGVLRHWSTTGAAARRVPPGELTGSYVLGDAEYEFDITEFELSDVGHLRFAERSLGGSKLLEVELAEGVRLEIIEVR
jgi:hypothetical protein